MTRLRSEHGANTRSSPRTVCEWPGAMMSAALVVLAVLALTLAGCGRPTPNIEATAQALAYLWATQTAEAQPTATQVAPTATLAPSATPQPATATASATPPPTDTSTSPPPTVTPSSTPTATPSSTPPPTQTFTPTPTRTSTPTPTRTFTPTPTPTPACPIVVDPQLVPVWDRAKLGCPTAGATVIWSAWEPFQHGYMWWRSDIDWAYVLNWGQNGTNPMAGTWVTGGDAWRWDGSFPEGHGLTPPAGLFEPVRGFGFVWFNFLGGPNSLIGWATDQEKGFCANLQPFQNGLIFHSKSDVQYCEDQLYNWATNPGFAPLFFSLANDGAWKRY